MKLCVCGNDMVLIKTSDGEYYYCKKCGNIILLK